MNVEDVKSDGRKTGRLREIFKHQHQHLEDYKPIEARSGLGLALIQDGFNIDDRKSQYLVKDYLWRVTEEMAEALDAGYGEHALEEVADGLHFLVEIMIITGLDPKDTFTLESLMNWAKPRNTDKCFANVVTRLGMAANTLKMKPWKQSGMLTDDKRFRRYMIDAFRYYFLFARALGHDAQSLYDYYFRKSQVNDFRKRSNY